MENHAENWQSTRTFLAEGRLEVIRQRLVPGDFLFVQFGHIDQKVEDPRGTDPATTYQENLAIFAQAAREKGAMPVFITPVARFNPPDAPWEDDLARWAEAMKACAARLGVAVIDLHALSAALVEKTGPAAQQTFYMNLPAGAYPHYPRGVRDNSHLQHAGALAFAGLLARALHKLGEPYASLLCEGFDKHIIEMDERLSKERAAMGLD